MKKTISFFAVLMLFSSIISYAQKSGEKAKAKRDSILNLSPDQKKERINMLKTLQLSKEQESKMKAVNTEMKTARLDIQKDTTLTAEAKKKKLRELRLKQAGQLKDILTPEQLEQFKEMRAGKGKDKEE